MTNADVAEMLKAGLPESTIVLSIERSRPAFDTSPKGLIQLKKAGATQAVMDAMIRADTAAGTEPVSAVEEAPITSAGSSVLMLKGEERVPLKRMTPTSKTVSGKRAIPYVGIFMQAETYAVFTGTRSDVRTDRRAPEFEIAVSPELKIADAVHLVRLKTTKSGRRLETMREGTFSGSTGLRKKDTIPISVGPISARDPANPGAAFYRVSPTGPLEPGEYALVIVGARFYDFGVEPPRAL